LELNASPTYWTRPDLLPAHFILGYGPFEREVPVRSNEPLTFEYRVFVHYNPRTTSQFQFAYGNPPYHPIQVLDLEKRIDNDFIIGLDTIQLQFLAKSVAMYFKFANQHGNGSLINSTHLLHPWVPSRHVANLPVVHQYPLVELLLSVATHIIHSPEGRIATLVKNWHPLYVPLLFPDYGSSGTIVEDSDGDVEIYDDSSSQTMNWETTSEASQETASTDPLNICPTEHYHSPAEPRLTSPPTIITAETHQTQVNGWTSPTQSDSVVSGSLSNCSCAFD